MQQKVDGKNARDLTADMLVGPSDTLRCASIQSIDALSIVFGTEQVLHLWYGQKRAKPLILIFSPDEEADIRISCTISTSA